MSPTMSEAVRKALRTFLIATFGLALPGLLGWLNDLTDWAHSQGTTPFPDAHGLMFILVSAIAGGFIAVLNFLVIVVEDATGHAFLRTPNPTSTGRHEQTGTAYPLLVWAALVTVLVVLLLLVFTHR